MDTQLPRRSPPTRSLFVKPPESPEVPEARFNPTIHIDLLPQQPPKRRFEIREGMVIQIPQNFELGAWEKADGENRITLTVRVLVNLHLTTTAKGVEVKDQFVLRLKVNRPQSFGKDCGIILDTQSFYLSELASFMRQFKLEDALLNLLFKESEVAEASALKQQSVVYKLLARLRDLIVSLEQRIAEGQNDLQRTIEEFNRG